MAKQDDIVRLWIESILSDTGLTTTQLAREAGLSPSTLTRYFKPDGPRHKLRWKSVTAIARRFERDLPGIEEGDTDKAGESQPTFVEFMRNSPLHGVELHLSSRQAKSRLDAF